MFVLIFFEYNSYYSCSLLSESCWDYNGRFNGLPRHSPISCMLSNLALKGFTFSHIRSIVRRNMWTDFNQILLKCSLFDCLKSDFDKLRKPPTIFYLEAAFFGDCDPM